MSPGEHRLRGPAQMHKGQSSQHRWERTAVSKQVGSARSVSPWSSGVGARHRRWQCRGKSADGGDATEAQVRAPNWEHLGGGDIRAKTIASPCSCLEKGFYFKGRKEERILEESNPVPSDLFTFSFYKSQESQKP